MNRASKGVENVTFAAAAQEYAAAPSEKSIAQMMKLACEGESPSIQQRASEWLWRHVGVKVVVEAPVLQLATGS